MSIQTTTMTDRKARIAALAARAGRTKKVPAEAPEDKEQENNETKNVIKFRNYVPQDGTLETKASGDEPKSKRSKVDEEDQGGQSQVLEEALQKAAKEVQVDSEKFDTLAPKKINWDLKRDIQPKLDKLERRTQRAIVALLRERLEKEATDNTPDLD